MVIVSEKGSDKLIVECIQIVEIKAMQYSPRMSIFYSCHLYASKCHQWQSAFPPQGNIQDKWDNNSQVIGLDRDMANQDMAQLCKSPRHSVSL